MTISYRDEFLSSWSPLYWFSCFVRLFPRGDCAERCPARRTRLFSTQWARCLLSRVDARFFQGDVEFVAALYNVFLRRDQVQAVEAHYRTLTDADQEVLRNLGAEELVSVAMASGDVNSIREALRKKNLGTKVEHVLKRMQLIQRNVRGSESERDMIMPKFFAMRLWNGCSSLFFTLNPHDIKSPVTIMLLQGVHEFHEQFSLELSDVETEAYLAEVLRENPRRLHELVAANPMVATRCFHWTVKLVVRALFHCADPSKPFADSVPARETPGVFGYVRG